MSKNHKPIFILGCPRSGTTILASILNRHSKVAAATETHFFNYICKQKKYNWQNFNLEQFEKILDESRIIDFYTLAKIPREKLIEKFGQRFSNSEKNPLANQKLVFDIFIDALLEVKNKELFCEKTPQHLLSVDKIFKAYPEAKIIHLIRDGRDTVNSLMKMPWRPEGLLNNSRFWQQYIRIGQNLGKKYPSDKFLSIRYEELLRDPERVLVLICTFIGIDFEADLIPQANKGSENIFSEWESSWKNKALDEIDSTRIGAWAKELPEEEQKIINFLLKNDLKKLDYEVPEGTKLSLEINFKIAREYISLAAKKLWRSFAAIVN